MRKKASAAVPDGFIALGEIIDREGTRGEIEVMAFKKLLALELTEAMAAQSLSKSDMALQMGTSRAQLARILDPNAHNVTIESLARAAKAVGKRLQLKLA